MKNISIISLFLLIIMTFYGCPVGLDYPIAKPGIEKIDETLLGTWICSNADSEVAKLRIEKKDDYSYVVTILERGVTYSLETDNLNGWITRINDKIFFYLQPDNESKYYHYMIKDKTENGFITCDVSLLNGGVDIVTSTSTLRSEVISSMNKTEYCTETLTWEKE